MHRDISKVLQDIPLEVVEGDAMPLGASLDPGKASGRDAPLALASAPRQRVAAREALALDPRVALAGRGDLIDAYKLLRSRVCQRLERDGHRVLAITSPRQFDGKPIAALNLAIAMSASIDTSVLLIDADLAHRSLQSIFGLAGEPGLVEGLTGCLPLAETPVVPGVDRLTFIPAGCSATTASAELIASHAMRDLVSGSKAQDPRRWILVHLPALLEGADAVSFLPQADTTLLLVEDHRTERRDLERCAELLAPFSLLGTVMTPASRAAPRRRGQWWPWRRPPAP